MKTPAAPPGPSRAESRPGPRRPVSFRAAARAGRRRSGRSPRLEPAERDVHLQDREAHQRAEDGLSRRVEQPGPLGDDPCADPTPGPDVDLGPGIEEPALHLLDLPEPLVLRGEGDRSPPEREVEAQEGPTLFSEQAPQRGGQAEADRLAELQLPAEEGRGGPDRLVMVADLEVKRAAIRGGVPDPEVLRPGATYQKADAPSAQPSSSPGAGCAESLASAGPATRSTKTAR